MSEKTEGIREVYGLLNVRSSAKRRACELIKYYQNHHPTVYISNEKNHYYECAIKEAYSAVRGSDDMPVEVLDRLLAKYDTWTHTGLENDAVFSIMMRAVDDLIDLILTS